MTPRPLCALFLVAAAIAPHAAPAAEHTARHVTADVAVYGATPGGIAAARAAARNRAAVLLIEPTRHVGGMTTSGLSHTDFRTYEGLTGEFLTFARLVEAHYRDAYGPDSQQLADCRKGTHAEPHVNLRVFEQMLADAPNVRVLKETTLRAVDVEKPAAGRPAGAPGRIARATFVAADGTDVFVTARIYIDATYEGDLMARAGVKYRVGREGKQEYGESLAPDQPDAQLQAYNFRLTMTRDPRLKVDVRQPPGYRRDDFAAVLPLLGNPIKQIFGHRTTSIYKAQIPPLPSAKHDVNDVSHAAVRLSMPGENLDWPDGDAAARRRVFNRHLTYNVGLLWFLQNDDAVPEPFRAEARAWGWCRDEFADNNHLPYQLYVREARRTVGRYVFTERDTDPAPGDARARLHRDAIATGDYGPNCHGTGHDGPRYGGKHTGEFYKHVPPYQVPYGAIVPRETANLLVPVAASSSHVGFCALRLEPIWMSLGEAAGTAARVLLDDARARPINAPAANAPAVNAPVPAIDVAAADVPRVQSLLHAAGAATVYVSDVPRDSPLFRAVQWLGTAGGLHGLAPPPPDGPRGKNLEGQYYHAFPAHDFDPQRPVDAPLLERWLTLLPQAKRPAARNHLPQWTGQPRAKVAQHLYDLAHQ